MTDGCTIYGKDARQALVLTCWRAVNKAKLPAAERTFTQKRILVFGETGDAKYLDGLQAIMPLCDTIAEYDYTVASALEAWVRANNPPPPPRPWPPVERAGSTFQRGQKVKVGRGTMKDEFMDREGYVVDAKSLGGTMMHDTVWVKFDLGESAVPFPDYQLEAA